MDFLELEIAEDIRYLNDLCRRFQDLYVAYGPGRCYELTANLVLALGREIPSRDRVVIRLVHGLVRGTGGDLIGIQFGHAWLEADAARTTWCIDTAGVLPAKLYYAAGKVEQTRSYSLAEVPRLLLQYRHYGPWDASHNQVCRAAEDTLLQRARKTDASGVLAS